MDLSDAIIICPGENDVYVSPSQIRKIQSEDRAISSAGNTTYPQDTTQQEKFAALLYV